jgi:hypothetical protein
MYAEYVYIKRLTKTDNHDLVRATAAKMLGKMRSYRSIPTLIDHITFFNVYGDGESGNLVHREGDPPGKDLLIQYPCLAALVDLGWPCIPRMIDEYIRICDSPTAEDDLAKSRIVDVIALQGNAQIAIIITKVKYFFSSTNSDRAKGYQELLRELGSINYNRYR